MTRDEMVAFATNIVEGGPAKKAEVQAFMKAYLDAPAQSAQPSEPETLPVLPFSIEKTDTGIHVPRDANRFYTRAEAAALIHAISKALET